MISYFAASEEALKNGTFWQEQRGPSGRVLAIVRYSLGDFQGYTEEIPNDLTRWTAAQAKAIREGKK